MDTAQFSQQVQQLQEWNHYVYIVRCSDQSLYTGYAINVLKRVAAHNAGSGAKYTRSRLPVQLVACWSFQTKSAALREERRIKKLSRPQKLALIESFNSGKP